MTHQYVYQNTLWSKRKRLHLTQKDLAESIRMSLRTFQRIEKGCRPPYKDEAKEIADSLLLDFNTFWQQCEQAWDEIG